MKVMVIGGVAAGTKAAAKFKRQNRSAQVTVFTKAEEISYAGCGLPYYVGGSIESDEDLIVNTPAKFSALTGVSVRTGMEAIAVNAETKTVTFRETKSGKEIQECYDSLILATGAEPFIPNVAGTDLEGVFPMRTPDDARGLRSYVEQNHCRSAVVVGGGFIGLEIAENLMARGLKVTVADMADQIMPNLFDVEMADYIRRRLQEMGMRILTGAALEEILGSGRTSGIRTSVGTVQGDLVVLAIGVRPATRFLMDSGLEMNKGTIVVDDHQRTSLPDIYAVGDCAQVQNRITGKAQWSAMGSTANITGRCLAKNLSGENAPYGGCLGTGVVRLAEDLNAGRTGLTEVQAKEAGFDPVSITCVTDDKAHYYPGASSFVTKLIADRESHRLLGIQVVGAGAVDKMVDIAVTGISMQAAAEDFDTMDFAYAPPFSTAIHPFVQACYILENKLSGSFETFTPAEYAAGAAKGYKVIDVQPEAKIPGAVWVNLAAVNGPVEGLGLDDRLLLVCAKGKRGYFLQNRLKAFGYTNTRVLEGGAFVNKVKVVFEGGKLPPAEIRRVKGLGCLQDKRYPDVFNIRVITRNGKITTEEHRSIAEAAEKFGTGEVTMTTRLTLEIQGVHYDDIPAAIAFLKDRGLETGGTGSLVRPVVSCKGTTCQYGLLDSYGLSEKLHERFYLGYHGVTLPHKFKIAVGGCPNNCVKPDLNDLGIIGQRVPMVDYTKCRGCKKCQVEANCPVHVANVVDGKIQIDPEACNNCGRCRGKCPFGALEEYQEGYKIYIGGRWGKKTANGRPLNRIFTSEEEVLDMVEKAILLFRDEGVSGERFADTIQRLGFDYVEDKLLNMQMDKSAVLNKNVTGGATC
ncbi:MAG: FAD-dependent oxidoreductase [Candidatus Limivivens sp.]|nr:FAD-dependent oxidoreductase [Candidatus Limivivens sp.]